jgi:hypothetical protein
MKKPTCKFVGKIPGRTTSVSFTADIPVGAVQMIQSLLERSFARVMADEFPDASQRPQLRSMVITIKKP